MNISYEYLAGMIDGEGCISMYRRKCNANKNGFSYMPYLTIASSDMWFLEKLQQCFGGNIDISKHKAIINDKYVCKECHSLRFSPNEIRELLPNIIPFLVLKKREGEILLEALEITKYNRYKGYDRSLLDGKVDDLKFLKKNREE